MRKDISCEIYVLVLYCLLCSKQIVTQSLSLSLPLLQTYPELIPFVNVCVQMMERVYQVQVQFSGGEVSPELMASTAEATAKSFAGSAQLNVRIACHAS